MSQVAMRGTKRKTLEYVLLAVVLAWATWLRAWNLSAPLFWVDEAESTINALTIVQGGLPVNHYMGMPIYENTLVDPWPSNPEYEFKDISYSDRGVAVYHGWLPLYSIAASLQAAGIKPTEPTPIPQIQRDWGEMRRMTIAARVPSVIFGMILLILLYATAKAMYGRDAGWAALLVGAFSQRMVSLSREARYYSATIMLSTASCLMVWQMYSRRRWRDFVIGGIVFGLLFHTHTITFLVACAAYAMMIPFMLRRAGTWKKVAVFAAIVGVMTVPWAAAVGLFSHASKLPKAWTHMTLPDDLFTVSLVGPHLLALLVCGVAAVIMIELARRHLPRRFVTPFHRYRMAFFLLVGWVILGYLAFVFLMPAVSYNFQRMRLPMQGPGIVLSAMIFAATVRAVMRRPSALITAIAFLAFMAVFSDLRPWRDVKPRATSITPEVVQWLGRHHFQPDTRIYATPNRQLIYTAYTGLPVQSIAPVRRSFLNSYPGEIILIADLVPYHMLNMERIHEAASEAGVALTNDQASELRRRIMNRAVRQRVAGEVAEVHPPLEGENLPPYAQPVTNSLPQYTSDIIEKYSNLGRDFPIIFRGYPIKDWSEWWPVYHYRFVNPASRSGRNLNYADRLHEAQAWVVSYGSTIYVFPGRANSHPIGHQDSVVR